MLRFARAVLGEDGVVVVDMASQLPWSRASLDEELAHDAELDVESLFCLHTLFDEASGRPDEVGSSWMHTHGLHELGAFDLDVVDAHPSFVSSSPDLFRALAFRALGGNISPGADRVPYAFPRFELRLVPADRFMREASPDVASPSRRGPPRRRSGGAVRAVGSEAVRLGRGIGRSPWRSPGAGSRTVRRHLPARCDRAHGPSGPGHDRRVRSLAEELEPYEVPCLAKLGLPTRRGGREHLWFEVHELSDADMEAPRQPPIDVDLRENTRGRHPLDLLTDWTLITPIGQVTPRSQLVARRLREHGAEVLEARASSWR